MFPRILEADDVLAWLCFNLVGNCVIVTMDMDFLQLVSEKVIVFLAGKKKIVTLNNFEEIIGVSKNIFLYYKAIIGDKSDNIRGVYGYGKVKAKKLALDYVENKDSLNTDFQKIINCNLRLMDLSWGIRKLLGRRSLTRNSLIKSRI